MKKYACLLTVLLLLVTVACGSGESQFHGAVKVKGASLTVKTVPQLKRHITSRGRLISGEWEPSRVWKLLSAKEAEYTWEVETDDSYDSHPFTYPVITGMKDPDKMKKINELIQDSVFWWDRQIYNDGKMAGDRWLENLENCVVSYEIPFYNNALMSIRFYGYRYYTNAVHPIRQYWTLNIDLEQCEALKFSDLFDSSPEFAKAVLQEKYVSTNRIYPKSEFFPLFQDYKNFAVNLPHADVPPPDAYSQLCYFFTFFTDYGLGISQQTFYAVGDYADLIVPYEVVLPFAKIK